MTTELMTLTLDAAEPDDPHFIQWLAEHSIATNKTGQTSHMGEEMNYTGTRAALIDMLEKFYGGDIELIEYAEIAR